MYSPLSATWDSQVRSDSPVIAVADLYSSPSSTIPILTDLPLEEWDITIDRNSVIRRTGRIRIVSEEILNEVIAERSGLRPYGSEIRLRAGFAGDLIPIGAFRVEDLTWDESTSSIQVSLYDRGQTLQTCSYGLEVDASGKQPLVFINDMIQELMPFVTVINEMDDTATSITFPGGTTYRSGKLQAVSEAAQAIGGELYFDVNGSAVIAPMPYIDALTNSSDYDWLVNTGEDGVLISYTRSLSRKDTYNKVHVLGAPKTQTTPQPYAFAVDDNPASPTYYNGPFGHAEVKIERQELTTDGQCLTYALAQLRNAMGLSKSLNFDSLCNPALDAGDVIRVDYPDDTFELHMIDTISYDQTGKMSIKTRARQTP